MTIPKMMTTMLTMTKTKAAVVKNSQSSSGIMVSIVLTHVELDVGIVYDIEGDDDDDDDVDDINTCVDGL